MDRAFMSSRTEAAPRDPGPRSEYGAISGERSRRRGRDDKKRSYQSYPTAPGQAWPVRRDGTHRPRCYKCEHWQSNMPMTGRCALGAKRGLLNSHDTMPGDRCGRFALKKFKIRIEPNDGGQTI